MLYAGIICSINIPESNDIEFLSTTLKNYYMSEFDKVRLLPWDDLNCSPLSNLYVTLAWERYEQLVRLKFFMLLL